MTTPWRHQVEALEFIKRRKRALLAMDMGTGKSLVIVDLVCQEPSIKYALITCPLAVVDVWPEQFKLHGSAPVITVPLGSGSSVKRKLELAKMAIEGATCPVAIIINHESLWRAPFGPWACTVPWDLLVVDESQKSQAPGGKFSMFLSRISNNKGMPKPRYRIGLTGTPMPNGPLNLYAQGRFIDHAVYGFSYTRFRARYAVMGGYQGKQVLGYQNMDEFTRKLDSFSYQVKLDDVMDLPESHHIRIPVTLSSKERKRYDEMEKDLITWIRDEEVTAANALVKLLRLQQITGSGVDDKPSSKHDALVELLSDLPEDEPVVVFGRFIEDLDSIHKAAAATHRRSSELSGRRKELSEWQDGHTQVLATQIETGGMGIDLTRARYCVYYSVGYSLGTYLQSLARIRRPGQTRKAAYYHLVAKNTVDVKVYQALQRKDDVVKSIIEELGNYGIQSIRQR